MNGSMQEGNSIWERGIEEKVRWLIKKWRLENRILSSAKSENKEIERKREQANLKRENAN